MIKGEGAEEKPSSVVASPRDIPFDRQSDGGDELSHYSSCGGESEFDRYCSASSAMGTPSFRGSSSFQDSDFGSLKSFKLGGENTNFKNFGAEMVLSGFRESKCGNGSGRGDELYCDEKDNRMLNLNGKMEGFVVGDADFTGNFDMDVISNETKEIIERSARISGDKGEGLEIDGVVDRNLSDEDQASSRYEHSEGEDSMFGCGSDDEIRSQLYYAKNVNHLGGENGRKENQLVMNSAVAFGADDWDDFIQEGRENTAGSMVRDGMQAERQTSMRTGSGSLSLTDVNSVRYLSTTFEGRQNEYRSKLAETNPSTSSTNSTNLVKIGPQSEDSKKGVFASSNQVSDMDELAEYLGTDSTNNIFQKNKDTPKKEAPAIEELRIGEAESVNNQDTNTSEVMAIRHDIVLNNRNFEEKNIESDPLSESVVNHHHLVPMKGKEDKESKSFDDNSSFVPSLADTTTGPTTKDFSFAFDQIEDHFVPVKARDFGLNDLYDEIVNDMEDILLDSTESPGPRLSHGTRTYQSQSSRPSRDGGSSASTSGTDLAYNWIQQPFKIDKVEVVGTKQKKGDVSFSERLVGVQKYTVYKIRVWSGEDNWEVERRYRDFYTLYNRLKKLFAEHGWTLPSQWSSVEGETRKLFGNASPDVIADRTVLIQECLQSIIHSKFPSNSLNDLNCFLSPSETIPNSPQLQFPNRVENSSNLGKTISLVVKIHPLKSMKQMFDAQQYRCAGCHRDFDDGRTMVQGFVQALGWGKPRLCEYSGQLFCSSCHNNDTAVLPAKVLHSWDFTRYPVSQLAKSFLDSIIDQPMLCVSAINPFLFSKVPTLQHVANMRNRIRAMLPYVRCPFRRSIYKGLGSRKYLLESNDFFALKDLIDLSKGVFSALPVMVETVSRKIQEHITEQCLVCYDVGIPCSARQDCDNPMSLIFPFQEGEVEKCRSCKLVFHKNCFKKVASCPCGARFKQEVIKQNADMGITSMTSNLNLLGGMSETSSGLLAGFFSKVIPGRSQILGKQELRNDDNVILMGSLPNTSL